MEFKSIDNNPFGSYLMAGFECADLLNLKGERIDFMKITGHLEQLGNDYAMLRDFDIKTVREGLRWSQVEIRPYQYDFSIAGLMIEAAAETGIQQVWDICHFGFPDDLDPFHPHFEERLVSLSLAFARYCLEKTESTKPLILTPINEVSFISWLCADAGETAPYYKNQGWNAKYVLMKAYIAAAKALKALDNRIVILATEPLVNIVPPLNATDEQVFEAAMQHEFQYQAIDMLCGRICPELGGTPELLDVLGLNFYYNNQWVTGFKEFLPWANLEHDERWRPLCDLLSEAYLRYKKPMILSETSHSGQDRPNWFNFVWKELELIPDEIPFWGVCLYPIIDRPDWNDPSYWHGSGLWDNTNLSGTPNRILYQPLATALREKISQKDISYETEDRVYK
ncbi:hypothetical protein B0I27_10927 [Arcticibacter pallidicorallinus]|uniref:Beta-glucosidase/6-phospho-beta-glucosidase/beta-galactosidase n=1 Tax=Arcticibacter pallidicorallinus TaxID=1259464 RepID=A0A2T0TX73_9SPHI|nr:amine oxidase [Arcticibacter pallidicorallinus]PRY50306.1 hypothetical protein B0I27_10927 [Arcticibacter pallidicorallinus]